MTARRYFGLMIGAIGLAASIDARAQCGVGWCEEWLANPSGRPTQPIPAQGLVTQALGNKLYFFYPEGNAAGSYTLSGNIERTPVPTQLDDWMYGTHRFVFVADVSGILSKLDIPDDFAFGNIKVAISASAQPQYRDLRRASCPTDTLLAEPVVQRRADSNAAFTLDKDIVIVATAHQCGDTTQNQVVALDAADITAAPVWIFNSGEYEMGRIHSCLLDLDRNRVVCGSELPSSSYQNTIWSIDTNSGNLAWATNTGGGVHGRPALGAAGSAYTGRLYVGDRSGMVRAFDAGDGTELGAHSVGPVATPPAIDADLSVGTGSSAGMVYATSSDGILTALHDANTSLAFSWETKGGSSVATTALPLEELGKIYAITANGQIHQFDLASGADQLGGWALPSGSAISHIAAPSLYNGTGGVWRLLTAGQASFTYTKQWILFCTPETVCDRVFVQGFEGP